MKAKILNKKNQFYVTLLISVIIIGLQWLLMRDVKTNGVWEWLLSSLFLFFILPIIVIKFYFKENLSSFHLSFNFGLREILTTLISGGIFIGIFLLLMVKFSWYENFPFSDFYLGDKNVFLFICFLISPLVIFFRQFFFLGFLLKSAEKVVGAWRGVIIFFIFLFLAFFISGKDFSVVVFSLTLFVNIFLAWLVLRTRTVILTSLVAWIISMVIDFTIFYQISLIR